MKISILAAVGLLLAGTSIAQAAWNQDQTVLDLQAQGYTHIEITLGVTQAKVEASNGTTKVETVYDLATGNVVKTETEAVDPNETEAPGIEIKTTDETAFVSGEDDDSEDDHDGVPGGSDDDEADDNGSDDDEADDNSGPRGDDDSEDDDSEDDDSEDDDSEDDDSGDDDGGDDNSGHGGGDDD